MMILIVIACVYTLSGCGGGGGGGRMPGTGPLVIPVQPGIPEQPETPQPADPMLNTGLGQVSGWHNNPTAQDLLDHWNDPEGLHQGPGEGLVALSSSDRLTRLNALSSILQTPTDSLDDSKTLLRNVDAGAMTVIGERNGITYGQWKGGPAGTLNIEFDWRFSPNIEPTVRAEAERAVNSGRDGSSTILAHIWLQQEQQLVQIRNTRAQNHLQLHIQETLLPTVC